MKVTPLIFASLFLGTSVLATSKEIVPIDRVDKITYDSQFSGLTLHASVTYSADCYKPKTKTALVQAQFGIIELYHDAERAGEICPLKIKQEMIEFYLGQLPDHDYKILDGVTQEVLAEFSVRNGQIVSDAAQKPLKL